MYDYLKINISVICYLATFRLDELGMAHFRKFVSSQDINKMYRVSNTHKTIDSLTCTYFYACETKNVSKYDLKFE